jgi:hypothetical protein
MTTIEGKLDQQLDIAGALTHTATLPYSEESSMLGEAVSGQSGAAASITTFSTPTLTITGLTGMTAASVENFLTLSGAASGGNNGTFRIIAFNSATSVDVDNVAGVASDANSGSISWVERKAYSLETDTNYARSDRANIKGVAYDAAIPTYDLPTAVGTLIPANLANIAGNTTDAKLWGCDREALGETVAEGNTLITITDTGNLKHADATDRTGVPVQDGADAGDFDAVYAEVYDPATGQPLTLIGKEIGDYTSIAASLLVSAADTDLFTIDDGVNTPTVFVFDDDGSHTETEFSRSVDHTGTETADQVRDLMIAAINNAPSLLVTASNGGAATVNFSHANPGVQAGAVATETVANAGFLVTDFAGGDADFGDRIYGLTYAGASTSPNSVEVRFFHVAPGTAVSAANAYTWERDQPTSINVVYFYYDPLSDVPATCNRTRLVNGLVGDAGMSQRIDDLQDLIDAGISDGDTHLGALLTPSTNFYVWSDLPDATPSVVEALNTLNTEIGDRTYSAGALANVSGLASGQTITASIEALALAIGATTILRVIERLVATILAGTVHTLPGGNTYTPDSNSGANMWVFWRGVLKDPGTVLAGDNYDETSTTQITVFEKIKDGDHINYFILQ